MFVFNQATSIFEIFVLFCFYWIVNAFFDELYAFWNEQLDKYYNLQYTFIL